MEATKIDLRRRGDRAGAYDGSRWLAGLTRGCYTVRLGGPERELTEETAADGVRHASWVRTLPTPFHGKLDEQWLDAALEANDARVPDVLAIAMQYLRGGPPVIAGGVQIAGDAEYGPMLPSGEREEGSDYNDYLGIDVAYPEVLDHAEPRQFRCLDCSGYMRMVWGYRGHLAGAGYPDTIPLAYEPHRDQRDALPRRADEIFEFGPGVVVVPNRGRQVVDFTPLEVGDLVFFDSDLTNGDRLDHVGIYLGVDGGGHHRFISSRKGDATRSGPTMGDVRGKSLLDGPGLYARAFRSARRL